LHRQLLLLDVVRPTWWYADITLDIALDTPKTCCSGHRSAREMHNNNLSSYENWYVSHCVVWIAIFYEQLCYCSAYSTFTICFYWWTV